MRLFCLVLIIFIANVLLANDSLESQIHSLETQNEHLRKDLELANKKFEILESKIILKSENLDELMKQIKSNEQNFNKTFDLYFWMIVVGFLFLIVLGLYKGYNVWQMKEEFDKYRKDTIDPIIDAIKTTQDLQKSSAEHLSNEVEDYKNKISRLYNQAEEDKNALLTELQNSISDLENRILEIENKDYKSIDSQSKSSKEEKVSKSNDDLLE